ncbi:MAG: hypothetical protein HZA50_10620 [Planctomycetes bacterium]|nr:hypothetical protein [Planctomycetota bacterium]
MSFAASIFVLAFSIQSPADQPAAPVSALAKMPVKEVTVFKDGTAFVLHAGKMPTDQAGNVIMDYLPAPILGTFWPFSSDGDAKLISVTASTQKVSIERTALNIPEFIQANIGAEVAVTEVTDKTQPDKSYSATLVGVPARSSKELEETSPPNSGQMLPQKGELVLLKTDAGVKAVNIGQIRDITIKGQPKAKSVHEEFRNLLTLKLQWKDKPAQAADVGMMYVQRGVRWIPSYKVSIDGKGSAAVKLQATLINELADLDDVTMHLVVGVPTFKFHDAADPMAFQGRMAQLSQYFQRDARTTSALSNAIMSQQVRVQAPEPAAEGGGQPRDLGPEIAGSSKREDLFVYEVKNVTLKKGQRMVLPIAEFTLPYKDVYTLDVPFAPPSETLAHFLNYSRGYGSDDIQVAKMLHSPKAMHKIRLTNNSKFPLTTAPALIVQDDRVLAQNLMQYTSVGGDVNLPITTAVDIKVEKKDKETARTPNAAIWKDHQYGRVNLEGVLKLTNRRGNPVEIEVVRHVLGNVGEADQDGKVEMVNVAEDTDYLPDSTGTEPFWYWWRGYGWPWWWYHFNGVGRISWKVKLDADKSAELKYTWHYYWE